MPGVFDSCIRQLPEMKWEIRELHVYTLEFHSQRHVSLKWAHKDTESCHLWADTMTVNITFLLQAYLDTAFVMIIRGQL